MRIGVTRSSRWIPAVAVFLGLGLAAWAAADVIVLKDGRVYDVDGPVQRVGETYVFDYEGQPVTLRRVMVDEAKTSELQRAMSSGAPADSWNRSVDRAMATPGSGAPRPVALLPYPPPEPVEPERQREPWEPAPAPMGEYPITVQQPRIHGAERAEPEEPRPSPTPKPAPAPKPERAPKPEQPPRPERPSASERETQQNRERLAKVEEQLQRERENLNALTELKTNASALTASDVKSLDSDIRRSQKRIEELDAERQRLEKDLEGR